MQEGFYFLGRFCMAYNSVELVFKYLKFLKDSKTRYRVHSPFVYQIVDNVLRKQPPYYAFKKIERWREELLENQEKVEYIDLGAGSRLKPAKKVCDIANRSLSSKTQSEWLFGLANYFNATTIVELGTSLGVSTAYLAAARKDASVISFESNTEVLEYARRGWKKLKLDNISVIEGNIDNELPSFLNHKTLKIDLVFIDANHTYAATIDYVNRLIPFVHQNALMVLDDIHWSREMEKAWQEIIMKPEVSISIDLFHKGIIFFRKDIEKEHFVLRV